MVLGTWVTRVAGCSARVIMPSRLRRCCLGRRRKDEGKATRLHAQAARELERAKQAAEPADLDPLLSEFNDGQMLKGGGKSEE
jgi:hypothetical protein